MRYLKLMMVFIVVVTLSYISYAYYFKNKKNVVFSYEMINQYPHDTSAWCQGLIYDEGYLYEGTGRKKGLSSLRKVEIETGEVLKSISLDEKYFGEGITLWGEKLIQLTYVSEEGFVYDKESFKKIADFKYPTEGWGLTHDGEHLIMSDGTSIIRFIDPESFKEVHRIEVRNNGFAVDQINELEYINNEIYANILYSDYIVRISPKDGSIIGWVNLAGILSEQEKRQHDVDSMNCIAYDAKNDRLFITGKLWPKLFEIKVI